MRLPGGACVQLSGLPGSSGDVGGDDAGGVLVQGYSGAVVADRGSRVGVRGRFLDVAQRDAGVEGCGDERVAERVGSDLLGQAGPAGYLADDSPGAVPVEPLAGGGGEDGSFAPFADCQVDCAGGPRRERDDGAPASFRTMAKVRWPRSVPRASMSAAVASETRSPFRASSEIRACSAGVPSPAATRSAPTSLRSSPVAWDS